MSSRRGRDEDEYYYREDFYYEQYEQDEQDVRPQYEEFGDDSDYSYNYEARHEQWLEDEGELRRRRRRQKREAELRRKKRIAILAAAALLVLVIAVIALRNQSGNVSHTAGDSAATADSITSTDSTTLSDSAASSDASTSSDSTVLSGTVDSAEATEEDSSSGGIFSFLRRLFGGSDDGDASDESADTAVGDGEDGEALLLAQEDAGGEESDESASEGADGAADETAVLYSYVETVSTIDLGSSLTDISIYDAQRHITSGSTATDGSTASDSTLDTSASAASDSGTDTAYGDSDGSEAASGETDTSSGETDTTAAMAADDYIDSQYVILVNIDTGEIVAERNAFDQIIPASMTKVMTLLVAVEAMDDPEAALSDTFTMTQEICDESYLSGSSFVGYGVGDVATVEDMLYGTILPSGADAAMGLAEYTAGSQEAFVALMNEKCEELGIAATTHFSNVIGLYDDGANYSTPYDMCVIMNAAIENDLCRQILSQRTWTTQAIMDNPDGTTISNWFLRRAEDHIDAWSVLCGKTGYVNESGNCAVSYYQSSETGTNYIACTALTYSSWRCIYDHAAIYNTYAP